nr:hypothetical protein [uncultured Allomuricauda sp.]|tara:strand:+ start:15480 stop:15641 length:162 start_codon:yes stop_codon:yes gene_type:complete
MKTLEISQLEQIEGGSWWGGFACGLGVGLIATGVGAGIGIAAVAAGCVNMVFY